LLASNDADKVEKIVAIFKACKVDEWALQLKNKYLDEAFAHLEDVAVLSKRKQPLKALAQFLVHRDY
ncbi:MAG: polyprenyl synthetase family protein, partial [Chitinophagaceae bacterium]|nr:polyprenyl synthetase family protein [Chitinophagaceae bacterium]